MRVWASVCSRPHAKPQKVSSVKSPLWLCEREKEGDYSAYCQLQSVYWCCARSACLHRRIGVGTHTIIGTHTHSLLHAHV